MEAGRIPGQNLPQSEACWVFRITFAWFGDNAAFAL
jgi:hypothetical protein